MDPLSHAALGRTLGALARGERTRPGALAATIAGALAPDLDAVVMPFGWDRYLAIHEIGTHSIFGTAACALLVATIVRRFAAGASWRTLIVAAWAGAVSHVLLDLLSSARIRALWPILDRQFTIPLVAMADPWLAAILVAGLPALWAMRWSRPAERLPPSKPVKWLPPSEPVERLPPSKSVEWLPPSKPVEWLPPSGGRSTLDRNLPAEAGSYKGNRRVAITLLALAALFLAIKAGLAIAAVRSYSAAAGKLAAFYQVQATWAALREWDVFDRTPSHLRAWHAEAGAGPPELRLAWPVRAESPNVIRSRQTSVVKNFLRAHELVFAVTVPGNDDRELVLWSDIRFCWNAANDGSPQLEPIVEAEGNRIGCGLWFGVEIDDEGGIVRQIVRIGGFTQTRAAGG